MNDRISGLSFIPGLSDLPGVSWGTWGNGRFGQVRTLIDAKRFELALLASGRRYDGSQTSGSGNSVYCDITYVDEHGYEVHLHYMPYPGEPEWMWQLVWYRQGTAVRDWQLFGPAVPEWPRLDSELRAQAFAALGRDIWLSTRPVMLPVPLEIGPLARDLGAQWDPATNTLSPGSTAVQAMLVSTLADVGFQARGQSRYRDDHSGQELTIVLEAA